MRRYDKSSQDADLQRQVEGRDSRKSAGFTLVEISLSIGIIAFAFVTLIGLLQSGMSSFRDSIDRSVSSQIAQAILSDKRQQDFATLISTASPQTSYFTEQGDAATLAESVYVAKVDIENSLTVPGSGTSRFTNRSLAKVSVTVVRQPGGNVPPASWDNTTLARKFIAYIPRK